MGLTSSESKLNECPQIPVCINTDDQGIFSTYLENEYALIALALEKAKDKDGKNLYNRMYIYQWIENIRKLGLQLSFAKPQISEQKIDTLVGDKKQCYNDYSEIIKENKHIESIYDYNVSDFSVCR